MAGERSTVRSPLRILLTSGLWTGLLAVGFTCAAFVVGDQSAAEKTATALVLPAGFTAYLLTSVVVCLIRLRQPGAGILLFAVLAVFYILSSPYSSTFLSQQLEARWTDTHPLEEEHFDAVVVLGGGVSAGGNGRSQGNSAGDRLILGAQMYHAGLTDQIICTGRRIESLSHEGDRHPADRAKELLQNLGIPDAAIKMSGGRTTAEELTDLGKQFREQNSRVGLITSAWHMNRALRLAHRCDFQPVPLPAGFVLEEAKGEPTLALRFHAMIPSADAMHMTSKLLKEYLAQLAGR